MGRRERAVTILFDWFNLDVFPVQDKGQREVGEQGVNLEIEHYPSPRGQSSTFSAMSEHP